MHELESIAGLFEHTVVFSRPIASDVWSSLTPDEQHLVANAVPKRQHEFASGRHLAKAALATLGIRTPEILRDRNRAPMWPSDISGSISHCRARVFVAVGRRTEVGSLGIDAEDTNRFPTDLWPHVFAPEEVRQLERYRSDERDTYGVLLFSAKESLYKAQYACTGTVMEFRDVLVELSRDGELACTFAKTVGRFIAGTRIKGRFKMLDTDGIVLTAVSIPS